MNYVLLILGFVCVLLGVIGIFLPVLPTTPFLLLASALFLRSSKRWYDWLLNHPQLGPYVRDFILHRSIPIRIKVLSSPCCGLEFYLVFALFLRCGSKHFCFVLR